MFLSVKEEGWLFGHLCSRCYHVGRASTGVGVGKPGLVSISLWAMLRLGPEGALHIGPLRLMIWRLEGGRLLPGNAHVV